VATNTVVALLRVPPVGRLVSDLCLSWSPKMPESLNRSLRLLWIIWRLADGPVTTRQLAQECGVTMRCVQRDILALQGEPFWMPLVYEEGQWRLMER